MNVRGLTILGKSRLILQICHQNCFLMWNMASLVITIFSMYFSGIFPNKLFGYETCHSQILSIIPQTLISLWIRGFQTFSLNYSLHTHVFMAHSRCPTFIPSAWLQHSSDRADIETLYNLRTFLVFGNRFSQDYVLR